MGAAAVLLAMGEDIYIDPRDGKKQTLNAWAGDYKYFIASEAVDTRYLYSFPEFVKAELKKVEA